MCILCLRKGGIYMFFPLSHFFSLFFIFFTPKVSFLKSMYEQEMDNGVWELKLSMKERWLVQHPMSCKYLQKKKEYD